jgi:O-antigen/teichoic acid export membrane protein
MQQHTKDLIILSIGKAIHIIIGLFSLRLLTELLSPEQVGQYYILISIINFLAFSLLNPLGQFYARHLINWQSTGNLKTATILLLFLYIIGLPIALLIGVMIFYFFGYQQYFELTNYLLLLTVLFLALTHGTFFNAINILVSRVKFIKYFVSSQLIGITFSAILAGTFKTAIAWMYGLAITQIIFGFTAVTLVTGDQKFSYKKFTDAFQPSYVKRVFLFIFPVTITLILQWSQSSAFRLIIENQYPLQILASISLGFALSAAIFSSIESLSTQFYMPLYLRKITQAPLDERRNLWNKLADIMLSIYVSATVFTILLAPQITNVLLAKEFREVFIYVIFGALIEKARVTTNLFYLVSQSEIKTGKTIIPYFFGFLVLIIGLLCIDATDQTWWIPLILLCSYLSTLLLMITNMRKLLRIDVKIFNYLKAVFFTLPLGLLHLIAQEQNVLNSCLLLAIGAIFVLIVQYFLIYKKVRDFI